MKLKYEAKNGCRVKYNFMGFEAVNYDWWWSYKNKKWVKSTDGGDCDSHRHCRSVRAFRRMLKTAPKGIEFILQSRWTGHNVRGFGSAEEDVTETT